MNRSAVRHGAVRRLSAHQAKSLSGRADRHAVMRALKGQLSVFASVDDAVRTLRPALPLQCLHPDRIDAAAVAFQSGFRGTPFYAVKSNPAPYVLRHLYAAGIRHFDVASLAETRAVRTLFPDAELAFMHPVKGAEAIQAAWFDYGVRTFVLDSRDELDKIIAITGAKADGLRLVVRLAMPRGSAACALAGKFGASPDETATLLRMAASVAPHVGLSFHVGSQTLDPTSYVAALDKAEAVLAASGVAIDVLDVGGGFPIQGLGMPVLPLTAFFDAIHARVNAMRLPQDCALWCEPGRALSGSSTTLVARVELRKDDALYLNDGSYGNLFEVSSMGWKNDVRLVRGEGHAPVESETLRPFRFWGPTCDSVDAMPGPFMLPEDVRAGDWIALDGMGAYGAASQSAFNGFYSDARVEVKKRSSARLVRLRPRVTSIQTGGAA